MTTPQILIEDEWQSGALGSYEIDAYGELQSVVWPGSR
jgi:hypothetical protein